MHILIQNPSFVSSLVLSQSFLKKILFLIAGERNRTIKISINRNFASIDILFSDPIFWSDNYLGNVGIFYFLHIISWIFSEYGLDKVCICHCWYPLQPSSFKSKLPVLNLLNQLQMIIIIVVSFLINNTNFLCSIIWTIIFFKAIKHNMPQMFPIHIERCRKKF